MAIYQKFGSPITITAYCGKHKAPWSLGPMVLVRVKYADDGSEGYQFAANLRADGGILEIDAAVDAAPEIKLKRDELAAAIKASE
jgi:hypothetical protein